MMRGRIAKKLYVYLLREILFLFLLSVGIFTFIMVLSRIGKIAELVINKGVGIKDILLLILYSSPTYLAFTLPMAFLLATVVTLGRLSGENEILALKANGVDLRRLYIPVAALGIALFFVGILNSNFLLPRSGEAFRNTLINIAKKGISIEDKEGIFNDSIPGIVIYIDKVDTKTKHLSGIIISDDRDESARQTVTSEKGTVNIDTNTLDLSFALKNGSLQRWEKQTDTYRSLSFKDYTFSLNLMNVLPYKGELRKKSYEMDLQELKKAYAQAKGENKYDFALEIYKKFSVPFSVVAFMLLTVPLGIKRKTEGKFSGVVYSLLIFISYYILSAVTENVGKVYEAAPLLVCFAPNIIFCCIGLYLVRRLNGEDQGSVLGRLKHLWEPYFAKVK